MIREFAFALIQKQGAAENRLWSVSREVGKQVFQIDVGSPGGSFVLRLEAGGAGIAALFLAEAIFHEISPRRSVEIETKRWGSPVPLKVSFGAKDSASLAEVEEFYNLVLNRTKGEALFVEEKNQRLQLLDKLKKISDELTPFVLLSSQKRPKK